MGMTLRTSEKQTEALRRQALAEGRSMQAVAPLLLDTGPPLRPFSFAELILQQSLLANAPPFVA